jgi:hypothetical protein
LEKGELSRVVLVLVAKIWYRDELESFVVVVAGDAVALVCKSSKRHPRA